MIYFGEKIPDFPGEGCTCCAYDHSECCCNVDWTDPEIYKLKSDIKFLIGLIDTEEYYPKEILERLENIVNKID